MVERILATRVADWVILVGVAGNAFLMARGVKLGGPTEKMIEKEITSEALAAARKLLSEKGERILLPFDVAIEVECYRRDIMVGDLPQEYPILDIGRGSMEKFAKVISHAGTVFISGPAGVTEKDIFAQGTRELMQATTYSKAFSVIGGGHTVSAAEHFGFFNKFSYVSTGGGALETFLLGKPLPVVEALKAAKYRKCPG
jgi:phosphoglycerate kinase